jgi:hypothetical protein
MFSSNSSDAELLKSLLEPLLDDFQYWLGRSRLFLEKEEISFLEGEQQADLLARVITAQQEVSTAQMLFRATDGKVGVETAVLAPWHNLVTECWQVAMRWRTEQSNEKGI